MFKFLLNFIPGVGPVVSSVVGFVGQHWHFFAIAGMIGMLAYQNFSDTRFLFGVPTIPHLEQQVAADQVTINQLKSDLDIAAKANAGLTKTITDDNATVQQWKDVSDKLQAQNNALVGTLAQMQKDSNSQVIAILKGQTPQTCEASIQYLRDMKSKLVW